MVFEFPFVVLGGIILIGFVGNLLFKYTKIPEALFLIILGLLIGPVFGIIDPNLAVTLMPTIAALMLIVVMLDNGISFDLFKVMKSLPSTIVFSLGIMTATAVGIAIIFMYLGFSWITAGIIGLILSGTTTDVITILTSKMSIKKEVKQLLVFESIVNDFQIIPFFILLHLAENSSSQITTSIILSLVGIPAAIIAGALIAVLWLFAIGKYLGKHPLNYAATIGILFVLYHSVQLLGGNGAISVLAFSFVLGNAIGLFDRWHIKDGLRAKLTPKILKDFRQIEFDISFFVRVIFFVFLGTVFSFSALHFNTALTAFTVITVILIIRFAVSCYATKHRHYKGAVGPLTWISPRGYVAAVLAFAAAGSGILINGSLDMILLVIYATTIMSIFYSIYYERRRK